MVSRRMLLSLLAVTPGTLPGTLLGEADDASAEPPAKYMPNDQSVCASSVQDRAGLKAAKASRGDVILLLEQGRLGLFMLTPGPMPVGDEQEGLAISSIVAEHHWSRLWDQMTARAEWFGAHANQPEVDCRPAIEAALAWCVNVRLGPGTYFCRDTVVSRLSGRRLVGSGIHYSGDARTATRIVVSSGHADVFRMGPDHPPLDEAGNVLINRLNLEMLVEGIEFDRTVPPDTDARPRGVVVQYCQDPVVRRVKSQDNIVDFAWCGTIDLLMEDCRATRARAGQGRAADEHIGYHAETSTPALTDINGNASARLVRCNASCTPAVPNSTGLLLNGRFTDHSIVEFETAACAVGIHIVGDGARENRGTNQSIRRNANVEIVRPWIDQFASVGLRMEDVDKYGIVRVSGGYFGPSAQATACIYDIGSQGTLLIGGEVEMAMAATAGHECRGVLAIGSRRLLVGDGVTVMEASFRAFDFADVGDVRHMGASVNEEVVLQRHTLLGNATACVLRPAMSGAPGKVIRAIEIDGLATFCTIDPAALNPAVLQGHDDTARRDALLTVAGRAQATGSFGAGNRMLG